jgi:hypothetical protein
MGTDAWKFFSSFKLEADVSSFFAQFILYVTNNLDLTFLKML